MKMKSVKIFGKSVPVLALALIAVTAVVAAGIIGNVKMPWQVSPPPAPQPTASMSPSEVTLPIVALYFGETKIAAPADVADLTVANGALDITASLGGDYGGFNALTITVQLVQGDTVKYEATIQPTIVVSSTLHFGPTGCGGWSDPTKGEVATCFVRNVGSGQGDLAQLVKWVPGATITVGSNTYTYPNTPWGYTYAADETGYIAQNNNDHDDLQLVLIYLPTSVTISGVAPGTYDVYIGFSVTAGNVASSGEATLSISW